MYWTIITLRTYLSMTVISIFLCLVSILCTSVKYWASWLSSIHFTFSTIYLFISVSDVNASQLHIYFSNSSTLSIFSFLNGLPIRFLQIYSLSPSSSDNDRKVRIMRLHTMDAIRVHRSEQSQKETIGALTYRRCVCFCAWLMEKHQQTSQYRQ